MKNIGFKLLMGTVAACLIAWGIGYLGYLQ